jgi:hypothetical protein
MGPPGCSFVLGGGVRVLGTSAGAECKRTPLARGSEDPTIYCGRGYSDARDCQRL